MNEAMAAAPRTLAHRFAGIGSRGIGIGRRCIGCGGDLPPLTPARRPCAECRARFAVHDPATELSLAQAGWLMLLVPAVTLGLLGGIALLALLPHLVMVWLGLGPLGFLLYFPMLAAGARVGRWLEAAGLREMV